MLKFTKAALLSGVACASLGFATTAAAQTAPSPAPTPSNEETANLDDVVVTATRIVRDGYNAPTPTTVIGAELLEGNAPATVADALQLLPAFRNVSTTGTANQTVSGSGGQGFANLRGLGATRTLVLINGQRLVPSTASGTIDLGVLPTGLLSRVDVVTGGASAVFGSDAVAGVVNFVLDERFTGFKGLMEGGRSDRGDYESGKLGLTWGKRLFDDRLQLLASGEYYNNDGVPARSRPWSDGSAFGNDIPNPAFVAGGTQPQFLRRENFYFPNNTFGGLIVGSRTTGGAASTALVNTEILSGGATQPFATCTVANVAGLCSTARDLPHFNYITLMSTPVERTSGFGRIAYDLTPDLKIYGEVLYGRSQSSVRSAWPTTAILGAMTITTDNPYLPTALAAQMATQGLASISLARTFRDFPESEIQRDTETRSFTAGFDANIGDWTLNGYASYGETTFLNEVKDVAKVAEFRNAVDAVRAPGGAIVCRSTLTTPGNGCSPLNPFGEGSSTQGAIDYTTGDIRADLELSQASAGATLRGEPFSTWAGPVSLALGAEYRSQEADQTVDAVSAARNFMLLNPQPFSGEVDVKEAFVETVVPLAKDVPFAVSLDLNAAYRLTDYSTSGSVESWKVGATWVPVSDLTVRATTSRDIRAPNLLELFQSPTQQTAGVRDPRTNTQTVIQALIGGNPGLMPEYADTIAAGLVFKPSAVPGLALSLDYYSIEINDAISTLAAQDIVNRCESGTTEFCPLVTRNGAGVITTIDLRSINFQTVKTSGFDFEASYTADLGNVGKLQTRLLANYIREYAINDGLTEVDISGSISDGLPKWSWTVSTQYTRGPFSWLVVADRVGAGVYNPRFTYDDNAVESVWYVDTTVEWDLSDRGFGRSSLYLNAANLFDEAPPRGFGFQTGPYDRIGRTYKAGLRFRF
jgi:iron complex outermembrane receptor protein